MSEPPEGYTAHRIGEAQINGDLVRVWLETNEAELTTLANSVLDLTPTQMQNRLLEMANRQVGWYQMLGFAE